MPALRHLFLSLTLMAAISAAALAPPAQAQSLIELYESARDYDATYQGARAQYEADLARAEQAKAGIRPQVGMSAGYSSANQELATAAGTDRRHLTTPTLTISATQPLYRPANWAAYEQSKRQADSAQAALTIAQQDLIVRVSQAYFDVLSSQDNLTLVRAQKAAVAQQLASARRNFEIGTATITDQREAQASHDLVVAREIAAENDLQVKRLALDQLVGRQGSSPVPLAAPVALPAVSSGMESWVEQAETRHPSIARARLNLEVATLEIDKARAGHKPTLDAQIGYQATNNVQGTSSLAGHVNVRAASVGVTFNLPLFAGFATENRIKETLALEEQARQALESTRRGVTQATQAAYLGLVSGAGQVKALEAAEASSQSALDANRLGYQVGVRVNIDVLNAQSQLFQTKRDLAAARYNVLMGHLKLRQANGTLAPEDLQAINDALALQGRAGAGGATARP
jgi:outer membrane protein